MSDLIVRDDARLTLSFSASAEALRELALQASGIIGRVTTPDENAVAVEAQTKLADILSKVEKARKSIKAPILDFGRLIDTKAEEFVAEPKSEQLRIARMVGDYHALEQARIRAEEQARNEKLAAIERERAAALAQAKTHDAADAISEHFSNRIKEEAPAVDTSPRANGQRISNDWDITVCDVHLLYRAHPNCCELKPRMSEIKELLKMGITPKGVTAKPIVKASVRLAPQPKAIDV